MKISQDAAEFFFRALFCSIFVGLGSEHLFSDNLILRLMPHWVPYPHLVSILCGLWLVFWGGLILVGWRVRHAAIALGAFLIIVSITVHLPGIFFRPESITAENYWLWDILQRSNLVKNACLLGVCFWLLHHDVGRYSLETLLKKEDNPKNSLRIF